MCLWYAFVYRHFIVQFSSGNGIHFRLCRKSTVSTVSNKNQIAMAKNRLRTKKISTKKGNRADNVMNCKFLSLIAFKIWKHVTATVSWYFNFNIHKFKRIYTAEHLIDAIAHFSRWLDILFWFCTREQWAHTT